MYGNSIWCLIPAYLKHRSIKCIIPQRQKFWAATSSAALLPISALFIYPGRSLRRSRISGQLTWGQIGGGGRLSFASSSSLLAFPWRLLLWWKTSCSSGSLLGIGIRKREKKWDREKSRESKECNLGLPGLLKRALQSQSSAAQKGMRWSQLWKLEKLDKLIHFSANLESFCLCLIYQFYSYNLLVTSYFYVVEKNKFLPFYISAVK